MNSVVAPYSVIVALCIRPGSLYPYPVAGVPHMLLALYVFVSACMMNYKSAVSVQWHYTALHQM